MNDFDFDAMQKKRIAQGAKHKVGRRSGCTLPSDSLTEAQKRKLNGPVVTLKLDEPMPWEDFKTLPEDKQRLYLERLKELYQPSTAMLGQMFGCTQPTVLHRINQLGFHTGYDQCGRRRPGKAERAKWDAFCNGVVGGKPGTPANTVTEAADDTVEPTDDAVETEEPVENAVPVTPGKVTDEVIHRKLRGIDDFVNAILDRPKDEPAETPEKDDREPALADTIQLNYVPVAQSVKPAVPGAFRFTLNGVNDWESVFALLRSIPLPEKADIAIAVRTGK